jgi:hypothetical protein
MPINYRYDVVKDELGIPSFFDPVSIKIYGKREIIPEPIEIFYRPDGELRMAIPIEVDSFKL